MRRKYFLLGFAIILIIAFAFYIFSSENIDPKEGYYPSAAADEFISGDELLSEETTVNLPPSQPLPSTGSSSSATSGNSDYEVQVTLDDFRSSGESELIEELARSKGKYATIIFGMANSIYPENLEDRKAVSNFTQFYEDIPVVKESLGKLEFIFKESKLSYKDLEKATLSSWYLFRKNSIDSQELTVQSFVDQTLHMGALEIDSDPNDAFISIDNKLMTEKTDNVLWIKKSGDCKLVITKNGYWASVKKITIKELEFTTIKIKLKEKK